MTFDQIPAQSTAFLDADTLIYYFSADPQFGPACQLLMRRIAAGEFVAYTSSHVLSNVAHRLMTLEAMSQHGWPATGIGQRLRRNPAAVQALTVFRQAVDAVPRYGIQLASVSHHHVSMAAAISQQTGLLSGDALIVVILRDEAIAHLAS